MARPRQLNSSWRNIWFCCLGLPFFFVLLCGPQELSADAQAPPPKPRTLATPSATPPPAKDEDDEIVRVETTEVLLPVTVRDKSGRLVKDLRRGDFRIWENEREQSLNELALREVPVDVVLMVDTSSSVAANLDDFRQTIKKFAAQLAPEDRISLITFDDRVELLLDWTQSQVQLGRALNRLNAGMFTRFNDALYLAAREQLKPATNRRHAIIILSDGIDSGRGSTSREAMMRSLLEAQASVYVISNTEIMRLSKRAELDALLGNSKAAMRFNKLRIEGLHMELEALDRSEQNLAQLAEITGGTLYKPDNFAALDDTYQEISQELRSQYALYYSPLDKSRDGKFRKVTVNTTDPTHSISARIGYYAPKR